MRKKNMIININYDANNQVICIKRYNKKEEVINLCDITDKIYNKLQKQVRKSMKYCKFYTSNKIFILLGLLLTIAVINLKFPTVLGSSFVLLSSIFCWNYASSSKKMEKENTIELLNSFSNSSFNDDYCYINTKKNIDSLINKNDKNKNNTQKEEEISIDSKIISIISDIRDMIILLNTTEKIFYCQRLNMLIDEYKKLRYNGLSEVEKVKFLSKLIILVAEIEDLQKVDCKIEEKTLRNNFRRN